MSLLSMRTTGPDKVTIFLTEDLIDNKNGYTHRENSTEQSRGDKRAGVQNQPTVHTLGNECT